MGTKTRPHNGSLLPTGLNVGTGHVQGKVAGRHTSVECVAFLDTVTRSALRGKAVHFVVDNRSAQTTETVKDGLAAHPRVTMHSTPTYRSWLTQVESWFPRIERDCMARRIFPSTTDLTRTLLRYIKLHNGTCQPLVWQYRDVIRRLPASRKSNTTHYPGIRGELWYADTELYGPIDARIELRYPEPKGRGGTSFTPFCTLLAELPGTPGVYLYASQWVLDEITSKADYLHYLRGKFNTIRHSDRPVFGELGRVDARGMDRPCVVVAQDTKAYLVALVLFEVADGRITRIDLCAVPPPAAAQRSGEYPGHAFPHTTAGTTP